MSHNILNVGETAYTDETIVSNQYHTYQPYASHSLDYNDEIRIPIQTQNIYTLPSESYLYIEGTLLETKENKPSPTLKFINNGILFLFEEIRYELGGTVIDRVRNPGITCTMKGYTSFSESDCLYLLNSGWSHLEHPKLVDDKGNFSVCIPLKVLLGFAEDYKKIILNTRQELVLVRGNSDVNATITSNNNENAKVKLNKIQWRIPHVSVSDSVQLQLLKYMEKDLTIAYRTWELHEYPLLPEAMKHNWTVKTSSPLERPRYVIFGFQSSRKNQKSKDMSLFDHCNLTNIRTHINSEVYPYDNINVNFDNKQWSILYQMYAQFQKSYYYKAQGEPCFKPTDYHHIAPIVVIDCSRQNEMLKNGAVDVRIEFETNKTIPADTSAYCLILYDRLIRYNALSNSIKNY